MSSEQDNSNKEQKNDEYTIKRRDLLIGVTGVGTYGLIDAADNGSIDGSPFRFISNYLGGGSETPAATGATFNGKYAQNTNPLSERRNLAAGNETTTETPIPFTETSSPTPTATATPTPTSTPTPTPTATATSSPTPTLTPEPTPTPTATATPTPVPAYSDNLGPDCDRLYLQREEDSNDGNADGTVIGLDLADREYRIFDTQDFPFNTELVGLYDELLEVRGKDDLPADLGEGVRTTRDEVFGYSKDAYDDMADEREWDVIWGDKSESECEL